MLKKELKSITGGLSKPSKMPCSSWSTPASKCITGSMLRKKPGSICSDCYACKGNYKRFPVIERALMKRWNANFDDVWVDAMVELISKEKSGFFRWFDAGDIKSVYQFQAIIKVVKKTPGIRHWLPTKEYKIAMSQEHPDNLTVRYSAYFIDRPAPNFKHTSTSHTEKAIGHECDAYKRKGKCGNCRSCWNKEISNISYKKH